MKNIIFLIDAQKGASGGGKVIYQYSNYINSLKRYSSSIVHVKKEIDGFILNRLQGALLNEAIRLYSLAIKKNNERNDNSYTSAWFLRGKLNLKIRM